MVLTVVIVKMMSPILQNTAEAMWSVKLTVLLATMIWKVSMLCLLLSLLYQALHNAIRLCIMVSGFV